MNCIISVEKGSIAEEIGIEIGDELVSINNQKIKDIFDYRYLISDEYIEVLIKKPDGEEWELEIEKEESEDLGIDFENGLMDKAKSCKNKCIFCFIDQLPKGMRETLYFKDDDSRLSFLQGNYITMTNMKDEDIDRIIFYHLSPINISVHATDEKVREFMIKNPSAKNILKHIEKLHKNNIQMNYQIVLCKGVNDGDILDNTIETLSKFMPQAVSLSVVPMGITKFRNGLYEASDFTKDYYKTVINQVHKWQNIFKHKYDSKFVFLSDEFYLNANEKLPSAEDYEDFPQIENGVGMLSSFEDEFNMELEKFQSSNLKKEMSIATGTLSEAFIKDLAVRINEKFPNITINVYAIENNFFGKTITVSGLITGTDIIEQLKEKNLGEYLMIPANALRDSESVFLDDYSVKNIEEKLKTKVIITKTNGCDFVTKIITEEKTWQNQ